MNEAVLNGECDRLLPGQSGSSISRFILLEKREYTASRSAFEHALQSGPEKTDLLYNMALTWLEAGDAAAARVILKRAQLSAPDNPAIERIMIRAATLGDAPSETEFRSHQQWAHRLLNAGEGAKQR